MGWGGERTKHHGGTLTTQADVGMVESTEGFDVASGPWPAPSRAWQAWLGIPPTPVPPRQPLGGLVAAFCGASNRPFASLIFLCYFVCFFMLFVS